MNLNYTVIFLILIPDLFKKIDLINCGYRHLDKLKEKYMTEFTYEGIIFRMTAINRIIYTIVTFIEYIYIYDVEYIVSMPYTCQTNEQRYTYQTTNCL